MATFEMRAGDNLVDVTLSLLQKDGVTLQPLQGDETVQFTFNNFWGTTIISKAGSIVSIPNSQVKCTLVTADTSALHGNVLRGKALVTFTSGSVMSYPTAQGELILLIH